MAARTKTVEEPEVTPTDNQGNPLASEPQEPKTSGPLVDVTETDLVDQVTGQPKPVSATTNDLQGTVSSVNGRVLVKVSIRGWIGEEPVVVVAEHAGEFEELIAALAEGVAAQRAETEEEEPVEYQD